MPVRFAIVGSIRALRGDVLPVIRRYIAMLKPTVIISGECPYGGVDTYAREESQHQGIPFIAHAPRIRRWQGTGGYKERNIAIAHDCNHLLAICSRRSTTYGSGCTADYAERLGKVVYRETVP